MPERKTEIKKLKISDTGYPLLLKEISNPPKELFVRGTLPEANKICIAIVGTRKATGEGRTLAKKIGKLCAEKGFVVVSGLAMGIDTAAHEGALEGGGEMVRRGSPCTIAVLGCGIDIIYPAHNENLGRKIETHGAIISEYPAGAPAFRNQFLERNRIVAGLSIATIVIEAPARSGALVTARLASESGREVFVFPGAALHPQYRGSHALIRDGARLVNSFEDILEDLQLTTDNLQATSINKKSAQSTTSLFDLEISKSKNDSFVSRTECLGDAPSLTSEGVGASRVKTAADRRSRPTVASGRETKESKLILEYLSKSTHSTDSGLILRLLEGSKTTLSVDKISELTHLSPQAVNIELGELVIGHIIEEDGFGYRIKTNN